jgi:hypothetical protein
MKWLGLIAFAVMMGCGGAPSPREVCERGVAVICEQIYTCYTDAELAAAHYPPAEAGCVTVLETEYGCANKTPGNVCDANEMWHSEAAEACVDQLANLPCSQVRATNFNDAPSCEHVCQVE